MVSLKNAVLFLLENAAKYGDTVHSAGAQQHIGLIQGEFAKFEAMVHDLSTIAAEVKETVAEVEQHDSPRFGEGQTPEPLASVPPPLPDASSSEHIPEE